MCHHFLSDQILLLQVFTAHHEIFIWGASRSTAQFGPVMNNTDSKGDTISQTNKENYQASWIPLLGDYPSQLKWFHCCFSSMDVLFLLSSFSTLRIRRESRSGLIMEPNPVTFISQSKAWCAVFIGGKSCSFSAWRQPWGTALQRCFCPSLLLCAAALI